MRRFFLPLLLLVAGQVSAQDVRINEFMANNVNSIRDVDGEARPWLEIWNNARSATQPTVPVRAVLTGWKLTNGTQTWVFPAFELPPEEHVIIWASGKDRRDPTAPLHTNFVLTPDAGGTLTLLRPDPAVPGTDIVVSTFTSYPAQQPDISYGRDRANPGITGFYAVPTPGSANNFVGFGVSGKVVFSVPSKGFAGSLELTLAQETPNPTAEIWYTTDRTDPTTVESATNLKYTGPITISATQMIRARLFTPGLLPGESDAQCYLLLDSTSVDFSSPIPVVAITTFGANPLGVADNVDVPAYMWVWEPRPDDQGVARSRLSDLPVVATRVAVDRRGSSTGGNPKMNLNVEARKSHDDEDKNIPMLGMPEGSDWVFHAPMNFDRTLLHNPLAMALSNRMGRYASRTKLAEVIIDITQNAVTITTGATGDYYGVYNIMEKIRRDRNRVNIAKLDMYDNGPVEKSGGFIWKIDRLDAGPPADTGFVAGGQLFAYYYPKEIEIKAPQRDPQEVYLRDFINGYSAALNSATYTDPVTGYAAWLDVPAAIDHHLENVWTFNVDALRLSGYMHKDRDVVLNGVVTRSKLVYGPQWDFDRALASTDGRDANPVTWRSTVPDLGTDFFNYPWWFRLFSDIDFYQKYIDRWVELRRGVFSQQAVNALIDELNAPLLNPTDPAANGEAVARDLRRWNQGKRGGSVSYPAPPGGVPFTAIYPATQAGEIQRMKDWLQVRANFFDSQWVTPVTASPEQGNLPQGTAVTLSAAAGSTIYYTTDGSDPRPSGGGAPTTALTYTGPIPIDATTRIKARAYDATWLTNTNVRIGANNPRLRSAWSGLTDARYSPETPAALHNLVVTELNYHPLDASAAELFMDPRYADSDFEWIEVKNVGSTTLDLGNARFTLGITFAFTGENAILLAPGEYAIIAANPQAFTARYGPKSHVVGPFTGDLDNSGERLVLVSGTNETILDFTYADTWYPASDGMGSTLVVYDEANPQADLNDQNSWRLSSGAGGSPGGGELPFVTTLAASDVGPTSAQLNAEVSSNGQTTGLEFVIATDRYRAPDIGAASPATVVGTVVTGLSPHTLYAFKAEATNSLGVRTGDEVRFTTLNRSPDAQPKEFHLPLLTAIDAIGSDSDPDGDELTISAVSPGLHGTVTTDGKKVLYTPAVDYTGNDSFSYTIDDGFGGTDSATVTLRNLPPVAVDDAIVCNGQAVTVDPRVNDTDPDLDTLQVSNVTAGAFGTVTISAGSIVYTPGSQFLGHDSFSYTVTDGSASASAIVSVTSNAPVTARGPVTGSQVPNQPAGTLYGTLGLPTNGIFSGTVSDGGGASQRAIFDADGAVVLKVGDAAPGVPDTTIGNLRDPNGQAVLATLAGPGVTTSNGNALYVGLGEDTVRLAAREGDLLAPGLTLKTLVSVDGNGPTVFFLATVAGPTVKKNDVVLCAVQPDGTVQILAREGDLVAGKPIKVLATLLGINGTLAEGRWRTGPDQIGVRLSFPGKSQQLYSIPRTATSPESWAVWGRTGDQVAGQGKARAFGVPGFSIDGVSYAAELNRSKNVALVRTSSQGTAVLASKGGLVPGVDGSPLPGLKFKKFADPIAGANGSTAFSATLAGSGVVAANQTGLWSTAGDNALKMLARAGDLAPGGGRWASFQSLVLPDGPKSGPLFTASLATLGLDAVTPLDNQGLWGVDSSGTLRLLLRTGQSLTVNGGDRTIQSFVALQSTFGPVGASTGFDDDGHVMAIATFTDNSQALLQIAVP